MELSRWPAPHADRPVDAVVALPGSKSLTNRYLVLAALACVTAPALGQPKETPLVASTINGPSEILKKGSNTWVKAKLRDEVAEGDGARALPGGRFVLRTTSGHAIRMAQLTQLFVAEPGAGAPA